MKINKYPDGTSYITVDSSDENITFKINSYEDLWHLSQFVEAMNDIGYIPTVTIPNLIDAQADRRFNRGESTGLKPVCNFLNEMNANFKIFHPHNPEVVEALMDNVQIIDNSEFIKNVLSKIYCSQNDIKQDFGINYHVNYDLSNLILMSSDAGGFKPLMKLCNQINWKGETFSASKYRHSSILDNKTRLTQQISRENFNGKDILIIDDISVYGGTFKGLAKMLKERNCGKLYLAVSHMTIQNLGQDPVTNYFDKVFTTNSKFDNYLINQEKGVQCFDSPKNLEIIKIFPE